MSDLTRRAFLHTAAAGGAVAGLAGFSALSHWVTTGWSGLAGSSGPFQPPTAAEIDDAAHVINRLTFGPRPGDHARISQLGARSYIAAQLEPEKLSDGACESRLRRFEGLAPSPLGELLDNSPAELLDQLTRAKILRATASERQLHEVMVDFWSDHFNIEPSKGDSRWFKVADDRDVIRKHAMGRFSELVKASALSPAMLWYLDQRVNRRADEKERPNENYGRELLELHTLGVDGGYTQRDVMEVARCLTGWTLRERTRARFAVGKVEFRKEWHDDGAKSVLGREIPAGQGPADLDRVVEIVSSHPSTARHIAGKLCRRFIADEPPADAVEAVASTFLSSGGDVRQTLRRLFGTEAFWAARGQKIKRPFHFVVSALRATGATSDGGRALQDYLLRMGHAPFQYPTPDGYPEEPEPWMATLLWRWRFALELAQNDVKGTRLDARALLKNSGGATGLAAHLLGRQPTAEESLTLASAEAPLALLLASPGFQTC